MVALQSRPGEEHLEGIVPFHPQRRAAVHGDETEDEDAVQAADDADGSGAEEEGGGQDLQVPALVERVDDVAGMVRFEDGDERSGSDGRDHCVNFEAVQSDSFAIEVFGRARVVVGCMRVVIVGK